MQNLVDVGDPKRHPEVYDRSKVSALFGLRNDTGVLCYVNAMVQTLVSCSAFNKWFMQNYKDHTTEPLWQTLRPFICLTNDKIIKEVATGEKALSALSFQRALISSRSGKKNNLDAVAQEDFQEGLLLLLDSFANKVDWLFHIHYQQEVTCKKCKHTETTNLPPDHMISITAKVETQDDMRKAVSEYSEFVDGHRCGKCGVTNGVEKHLQTTRKLVNTSEILIIYYLKYAEKTVENFPADLAIKVNGRTRHYQIVSQIEHRGAVGTQKVNGREVAQGSRGGHYWVRSWRPKPLDFHQKRSATLQDRYAKETDIQEKVKIQRMIKDWDEDRDNPMTFFHINDVQSHYPTGGFVCTKETYMVVYHLMAIQ
jgi:ubiquitin C-terminal hydrolase